MNDLWHWPLVALSLIGVVLNVKHDRRCFWCWIPSNATWCVIDFSYGLYSQSALMGVYLCLGIWGLIEWSRKP